MNLFTYFFSSFCISTPEKGFLKFKSTSITLNELSNPKPVKSRPNEANEEDTWNKERYQAKRKATKLYW